MTNLLKLQIWKCERSEETIVLAPKGRTSWFQQST
jgi:hypothetical protein